MNRKIRRLQSPHTNQSSMAQFEQAKQTLLQQQVSCILCGNEKIEYKGILIPDDSALYGAPKGKTRLVVYGLCSQCGPPSDAVAARVEAKMPATLYPDNN